LVKDAYFKGLMLNTFLIFMLKKICKFAGCGYACSFLNLLKFELQIGLLIKL